MAITSDSASMAMVSVTNQYCRFAGLCKGTGQHPRIFNGNDPKRPACNDGQFSYVFSVKRSNTIPVPGSPTLARDLAATAAETELSQADVIRQSIKLGMPALRARLGKS